MKHPNIPIFILAAVMSASTLAVASDDDEQEFEEAYLYFELNDTDGDLDIHGKADGDSDDTRGCQPGRHIDVPGGEDDVHG